MFEYQIEKTLAELSSTTGGTRKLLTVTAWNGRPGKLDLRTWREVNGEQQPGRGVTLNEEEADTLLSALQDYLRQ